MPPRKFSLKKKKQHWAQEMRSRPIRAHRPTPPENAWYGILREATIPYQRTFRDAMIDYKRFVGTLSELHMPAGLA